MKIFAANASSIVKRKKFKQLNKSKMRPLQKRNFIAYYIEIKLKERDANFSLSDMIQKISQFRYTEQAHNFEQYEKEILQYYKSIEDDNPEQTYKETLIQKNII